MMDMEWLRRLIALVDESGIDTLEIRRFGTRVRISKSPTIHVAGGVSDGTGTVPRLGGNPASGWPAEALAEPATAAPAMAEEPTPGLHEVTSPMVGTFYRAPAPDAPPYVEVGDRVRKGDTLCILEAMKLMNELESEVSGVVREICVENADPVEFGQVLFRIEVDGEA